MGGLCRYGASGIGFESHQKSCHGVLSWILQKKPGDIVYRFWGTARTLLHGMDYTGRSALSMQPQSAYVNAFDEYTFVEKNCAPIYIFRDGVGKSSGRVYEIIRVPFGCGDVVTQILSVGTCFEDDLPESISLFSYLSKPKALK